MLTIPTVWKQGSSDRNVWLNTTDSTPLLRVRIWKTDGEIIRMTNIRGGFSEEDGIPYLYEETFWHSLTSIGHKFNIGRSQIGATGEMNQLTLRVNAGEVNQTTFLHGYPIDNYVSAKVDVWLLFAEGGEYITENSLHLFNGKISNYKYKSDVIEFIVEDFSFLNQRKLPLRYQDWLEKYPQTWTIPDFTRNEILPMNFGNAISKVFTGALSGTYMRRIYLMTAWPIPTNVSDDFKLFYWDKDANNYFSAGGFGDYFVNTMSAELMRTITIWDVADLPDKCDLLTRVPPAEVHELNSLPGGNPEAWRDQTLESLETYDQTYGAPGGAYIYHGSISDTSYSQIWQLIWNYDELPEGVFNAYFVTDISHNQAGSSPGTARFYGKIYSYTGGLTTVDVPSNLSYYIYDNNGTTPALLYLAVPSAYCDLHADFPYVSCTEFVMSMASQITKEDVLDDYVDLRVAAKRIGTITACTWKFHEGYLLFTRLTPDTLYASGNWGNGYIQPAIESVYDNFLDLDSDDFVTFVNMARNYEVDGTINEEMTSLEFFDKLAKQYGLLISEDADGKTRVIDINGKTSDYVITDEDLLIDDEGILSIEFSVNTNEIYSRYKVDYKKTTASGKYMANKYVSADDHNLEFVDSTFLQQLCIQAQSTYASKKEFILQCDLVRTEIAAEEILEKAVKLLWRRHTVAKFTTSLRMIDLQEGDQIRFGVSINPNLTNNFFITSKTINHENRTIDFIALENSFYDYTLGEGEGAGQKSDTGDEHLDTVGITELIAYYSPMVISGITAASAVASTIDPTVKIA